MLRLIGIVISIALADSLNPSTLAPALYLAAGDEARHKVAQFTLGVFAVTLVGALILVVGPGQLLLHLLPHPRPVVGYWLEVVAGVVLLVGGGLVWRYRLALAEKQLAPSAQHRRSAFLLGAGIMALEFPTAFPLFGAIAAIVGSGRDLPNQVILIVLYCGCFVLPLVGILAVVAFAGDRATAVLGRARQLIQSHWALVLGIVLLVAGAFVITLGVTGVASHLHGRLGRYLRGLRHFIVKPHL